MVAFTQTYGLPYEEVTDAPASTLRKETGPLLAEAVEDELVRIDANLATIESRLTALEAVVPQQRIATSIATADSGTTTTSELQVMSITAPLVEGRIYRVRFHGSITSSVGGDSVAAVIRQDNTGGNQVSIAREAHIGGGGTGTQLELEGEYTAVATGNKTFVVTILRVLGTGNVSLDAASNHPAYLYVDYIRDGS